MARHQLLTAAEREERDRKIREASAEGVERIHIAARFGLTATRVSDIIRGKASRSVRTKRKVEV